MPAMDGGWGWMVVLGGFIGHVSLVGLSRSSGLLYIFVQDRFQSTASQTAWVFSIFNTSRMLLGPSSTVIAEHLTYKRTVGIGALSCTIAFFSSAFTTELYQYYLIWSVLGGVSASLIFAPMLAIIAKYFDKKKGKAMSISTLGAGLGTVVVAPYLSFAYQMYGFFGAMLATSALISHCTISASLFRSPPVQVISTTEIEMSDVNNKEANYTLKYPVRTDDKNKEHKSNPPIVVVQSKNKKSWATSIIDMLKLLTNFTFLLYCLNMAALPHGVQCCLLFLPAMCREKGFSKSQGAILISISGLADVTGRLIAGIVFDLSPVRNKRRALHSVLGIAGGFMVISLALAETYTIMIISAVFWASLMGAFHGQRATVLSQFIDKEVEANGVGWVIFSQGIGNFVGPTVSGILRERSGTYTICYYYMGCVVSSCSFLFLLEYLYRQLKQKHNLSRQAKPPVEL